MKKSEIRVGGLYTARINGKHVTVRVDSVPGLPKIGYPIDCYSVTNLSTGHKTTFHSAAKFRNKAKPAQQTDLEPVLDTVELAIAEGRHKDAENMLHNDPIGKLLTEALIEDNGDNDCPFVGPTMPPTASVSLSSDEQQEGENSSDFTIVPTATQSNPILGTIVTSVTSLAAKIAATQSRKVACIPETVAGYTPTDEQRAILEKVLEILNGDGSKVLVVNAGAGSGKTLTLKMLEEILYGQIQYTAYNRPLVDESRTKFRKAKCSTGHGLAFGPVGSGYKHRLNGNRVRSWEIAQKLGITDYQFHGEPYPKDSPEWTEAAQAAGYNDCNGQSTGLTDNLPPTNFAPAPIKTLKAAFLAGQVSQTLKKFSQTADREISAKHFQYITGVDEMDELTGRRGRTNNDAIVEYLLPFARKFWEDVCNVDGVLPFQHDYYVKIWQLSKTAIIPADHILLDEHQDTAPVFADVIQRQSATLIMVGDVNQRIYEWRGACNAADLFPDAPILYLSQSFRFGQAVADVANSILAGLKEPTKLDMRGLPSIHSRVLLELPTDERSTAGREEYGNPTADDNEDQHVGSVCYLYRTNAGAVARIITEYATGRRGCLVGKIDEVVKLVEAARDLQSGKSTTHPELAVFEKWTEVQKYVEEDPDGGDLKLMVKLIDQFTCKAILEALHNMPAEKDADFVCSTSHKSKGREWDTVVLGADFPPAHKMGDSDRRLLYVAATRAKLVLDLTACTPFRPYKDKDGNKYPCIEVDFTRDQPTYQELLTHYAAKSAPQIAAPKMAPTPLQSANGSPPAVSPQGPSQANVAQANGNGHSRPLATGFTWTNFAGKWSVRGPAGAELNTRVKVDRKNGTSSQETLRKIVRQFDDACIYEV